jgi:hypothetical protein
MVVGLRDFAGVVVWSGSDICPSDVMGSYSTQGTVRVFFLGHAHTGKRASRC